MRQNLYSNIKQKNGHKLGWTFIHPIVRTYYPWFNGIMASRIYPIRVGNNGLEGKKMDEQQKPQITSGIASKLL